MKIMMRWVIGWSAAALLATGCSRSDAPKVPLGRRVTDSVKALESAHALLGPDAKMRLDSGNAFFRKKQFAAALVQYRAASELAPQHAAPLFGIYMVGRATNDTALADSALSGIRLRSGSMSAAPHPTFSDSALKRAHENLRKPPATSGL